MPRFQTRSGPRGSDRRDAPAEAEAEPRTGQLPQWSAPPPPPSGRPASSPDDGPPPGEEALTAELVASSSDVPPPPVQPPPPVLPEPGAPVPTPATGRAGRNLGAAIGVGVGMGALVLATLFVWKPAFVGLVLVAVLVSLVELTRALGKGGHRPPLPPLVVGAVLMIGLAWTRGGSGLVVGFLLSVFAVLLWRLGDGPGGYLDDAASGVLVSFYVPLLAGFAVLLLVPDDGVARVLAFVATVVCNDVGGYAAGVLFGKHPMAPSVSPKKSWEGFAGSVTACVLIGVLLVVLTFHGPWWGGVLFGGLMAVSATIGDLGESLIKRDLGIKDMGDLLPGHGGLMDRMDSLLPSAAIAYLVLSVVVPA